MIENNTTRGTMHNGKYGKDGVFSPEHNDRRFALENSPNIDPERTKDNIYVHCFMNVDRNMSFEDAEKKFYLEYLSEHLKNQNERHKKSGHKERIKTIEEYRRSKKTCPEETIIQLGNKDNYPDANVLKDVFNDYIKWHQEKFPNAKILDFALHLDEATPHIHLRKVWVAIDDDGDLFVNQNQAFQEMGIERPHPDKKQGRYNNPKMIYSEICRDKFIEIAKDKGIDIEVEPKEPSKKSKDLLEWQLEQDKKHIEELEQTIEKTRTENKELRENNKELEENIKENEKLLKSQNTSLQGCSEQVEKYEAQIEEKEKIINTQAEILQSINEKMLELNTIKKVWKKDDTITIDKKTYDIIKDAYNEYPKKLKNLKIREEQAETLEAIADYNHEQSEEIKEEIERKAKNLDEEIIYKAKELLNKIPYDKNDLRTRQMQQFINNKGLTKEFQNYRDLDDLKLLEKHKIKIDERESMERNRDDFSLEL